MRSELNELAEGVRLAGVALRDAEVRFADADQSRSAAWREQEKATHAYQDAQSRLLNFLKEQPKLQIVG